MEQVFEFQYEFNGCDSYMKAANTALVIEMVKEALNNFNPKQGLHIKIDFQAA